MTESKQSVQNNFAIRSIFIRKSEMSLHDDFDPSIPNQLIIGSMSIGHGSNSGYLVDHNDPSTPNDNICEITQEFEYAYFLPAKSDTATETPPSVEGALKVASLRATICATYFVKENAFADVDLAVQFGKEHAMLHIWPYWREYCQSSFSRMNLPLTTIPLLNLQPAQKNPN